MGLAPREQRTRVLAATVAFVAALVVFARTAYPTITWWDSSSYSLAAATLGIASPPGSLLLTVLGWPIAHLPFVGSPALALNILAAVFAALTVSVLVVASGRVIRLAEATAETQPNAAWLTGATLGALAFAFSGTLWSYAGRFTPYVLSAVFTGLILWTLLRWWEEADAPDAWRWVGLLGQLFGLDFSVHRTNALLIPGALVWIVMRRPRTLRDPSAILAGIIGLVAGLAVQLLLIPIAAFSRSSLDFNHPSTFSEFWDYVTIKQLGGSFLLQLFPRKSPIWSVQARDLLQVLGDNFLHLHGSAGALGLLPAVAVIAGFIAVWRGNRRLAVALTVLLVTQAALTVLYFNIPPNYFRTFDRHYLPVCVTMALLMVCGVAAATRAAEALRRRRHRMAAVVIAGLAVLLPASQLVGNWRTQDASRRFFAQDYASNALRQLPPNAIYFTVGDNDTFPVMYMQSVEGVRPDVTIINLSVANIPDWPDRLRQRDPTLPMSLSVAERTAATAKVWMDTVLRLAVPDNREQVAVATGTPLPASLTVAVTPRDGTHMLPAEVVLLDIVRTNEWRRPLTFAITGTRSAMEWLAPYGRAEGLYFRFVPVRDPPSDPALLRAHLFDDATYRGYADAALPLDDVSRTMGVQYYAGLQALLESDMSRGDPSLCLADRQRLLAMLPLARLDPPAEIRSSIEGACRSARNRD